MTTDAEYWAASEEERAKLAIPDAEYWAASGKEREKTSICSNQAYNRRATFSLQRLLSIWWLMAWRGVLGGLVLGALAGMALVASEVRVLQAE